MKDAWEETTEGKVFIRRDGAKVIEKSLFNFHGITPDGVELKTKTGKKRSFTEPDKAKRAVDRAWKFSEEVNSEDKEIGIIRSVEEGDLFRSDEFSIIVRRIENKTVVFRMPGGIEKKVEPNQIRSFLKHFERVKEA